MKYGRLTRIVDNNCLLSCAQHTEEAGFTVLRPSRLRWDRSPLAGALADKYRLFSCNLLRRQPLEWQSHCPETHSPGAMELRHMYQQRAFYSNLRSGF